MDAPIVFFPTPPLEALMLIQRWLNRNVLARRRYKWIAIAFTHPLLFIEADRMAVISYMPLLKAFYREQTRARGRELIPSARSRYTQHRINIVVANLDYKWRREHYQL